MDTMTRIRLLREERARDSARFNRRLDLLAHLAPVLDALPEALSPHHSTATELKIGYVAFYGKHSDAEVRALCAEVRRVLRVRKTDKHMGGDGELVWTTETADISVVVYGGEIPANCRLVPSTRTVTTYTMECVPEPGVA